MRPGVRTSNLLLRLSCSIKNKREINPIGSTVCLSVCLKLQLCLVSLHCCTENKSITVKCQRHVISKYTIKPCIYTLNTMQGHLVWIIFALSACVTLWNCIMLSFYFLLALFVCPVFAPPSVMHCPTGVTSVRPPLTQTSHHLSPRLLW